MNSCEECIVYELRHGLTEAGECPGCGKKTLNWKQGEFGDPYLECAECSFIIGVDLNTPCELDPIFNKKATIFIDSQKKLPDKNAIMILARDFGMNALQMHKCLKEGFTAKMSVDKLDKAIMDLKTIGVEYRVDGFENLRDKYPFYRECGYPYSAMQICIQNDEGINEGDRR